MEFDFGKKLKELRAGREITQETLAQHLQISPQAVSKWERGEGYPDIMLLPRIAAFFDVAVDELLGTTEEIKREKIECWKKESQKLRNSGERDKDLELWEEAYNRFPNDLDVISEYMKAVYKAFRIHFNDDDNSESQGNKVVFLGEEILARSKSNNMRSDAIRLIALTSNKLGDSEKAREYSMMEPSLDNSRELLLCEVLKDEEQIVHCQKLAAKLVDLFTFTVSRYLENKHPVETRIEIMQNVIGIYQCLFKNGDYGFSYDYLRTYSSKLSRLYAIAGDRERCVEELQRAFEYAVALDDIFSKGEAVKHTSPLMDRSVFDPAGTVRNYPHNTCWYLLNWDLKYNVYDPYRDDPEFLRIKTELEKRAV